MAEKPQHCRRDSIEHADEPSATRAPRAAGFTLIEIAVVVVLIGILATFAVLSIGDRAAEDRLNAEAERSFSLFQLASDEATLKSLQIGVLFTVSGYQFVVIGRHRRWETYDPGGVLRPQPWPGGVKAELHVEGRLIPPSEDPKPGKTPPPAATSSGKPASASSAANSSSGDSDEKSADAREKDPLKPQLLLLSSGEMTAFALDLKSAGLPFYFHLEGDETGHLKLQRLAVKP